METLVRDLRFGLRMLRKNPASTAAALLVLTLGIGANTAIFTVVNAVLLRPLPYADPARLVSISECNPQQGIRDDYVSEASLVDWRDQNRSFVDLAAISGFLPDLTVSGKSERVLAASVTSNYFSMLGVKPQIGRAFFADEGGPGRANVVVLSNACWRGRFR